MLTPIRRMAKAGSRHLRARYSSRDLRSLDDHILRDIGLTRHELDRGLRQS